MARRWCKPTRPANGCLGTLTAILATNAVEPFCSVVISAVHGKSRPSANMSDQRAGPGTYRRICMLSRREADHSGGCRCDSGHSAVDYRAGFGKCRGYALRRKRVGLTADDACEIRRGRGRFRLLAKSIHFDCKNLSL